MPGMGWLLRLQAGRDHPCLETCLQRPVLYCKYPISLGCHARLRQHQAAHPALLSCVASPGKTLHTMCTAGVRRLHGGGGQQLDQAPDPASCAVLQGRGVFSPDLLP